jgi:hypothetical protein
MCEIEIEERRVMCNYYDDETPMEERGIKNNPALYVSRWFFLIFKKIV